ncbi:MAG: hypothetical protein ABR567_14080 [Myxococcales bacterium]|nr:hypothetical protein [Myxococcales bacterium]
MRALTLLAVAATLTCSYEPPGSCTADASCGPGTKCQSSVCLACPNGLCPFTEALPVGGDVVTVLTTPFSSNTSVTVRFPTGAAPGGTPLTLSAVGCPTSPPPPLGGGCVAAFNLDTPGVPKYAKALTVRGASAMRPGTELMVAELLGGVWVDRITAVAGGTTFKSLHATTDLPGVLEPGTYLVYSAGPGVVFPPADFGVALIPDDGNGTSGLQVVTLFDDDGEPLNPPTLANLTGLGGDLDGAALTPDGSQGVMVDGGNFIVFFSGVGSGQLVAATAKIDISPYGLDGDAIAIMPDGNEAVISADSNTLVVISGIFAGNPVIAATLPIPAEEDGLVISNDGKVLLARGSGGMSVFGMASIPPTKGPIGGTLTHSYTHVVDFTNAVSSPIGEDGRDGLAVSPANSANGAVVGRMLGASSAVIQLVTGLPGSTSTPPTVHPAVPISGALDAFAVAITPDGTRAIVGTDAGLVMFTGVDSGSLVQTGPPFAPAPIGTGTSTFGTSGVPTLGITLDGKYVAALTPSPDPVHGTLLLIPIQATDFGAPVSTLGSIAVPSNDQILLH